MCVCARGHTFAGWGRGSNSQVEGPAGVHFGEVPTLSFAQRKEGWGEVER